MLGATQCRVAKDAHNRDEDAKLDSGQNKERPKQKKVQDHHICHPETCSWYGHVMRIEDTNVAKQVTTMKVGVKRHRGGTRLRWVNRVRNDLRHQLDPKLAQNR